MLYGLRSVFIEKSVFVVENIGKLIVENVGNPVEFVVVLDSFENILADFVDRTFKDNVLVAFLFSVFVHRNESLVNVSLMLERSEKSKV